MPATCQQGKQQASKDPEYEKRLHEAMEGLQNGRFKSIQAAADAKKVSKSTLSDRIQARHIDLARKNTGQQLLSPTQKRVLVDWYNLHSAGARPLHPRDLCARAFELTNVMPGKNWHYGFLKRHANKLIMNKPWHLDPKQGEYFTAKNMEHYFGLRQAIEDDYGPIPPEHHWNEDEKGGQYGGGRKSDGQKFIFSKQDRDRYKLHNDNLELVTIIECANAAGEMMKPCFVMKEGPLPDPRERPELFNSVGGIARSETGWTDREICIWWFENIFVPEAEARRVNNKPIVLTVDGHDSHETDLIKSLAYKYKIIIIVLPSKSTHKTQPLNVGIFGTLQWWWSKHVDKLVNTCQSMTV